MLKCSDAVLQLECLTASWQKQKPMHTMEEKEGYRMAGVCLVSMPVSNGRCGAQSFHLPRSTQPHGSSPLSIFLTFSLNHSTYKTLFSAPPTLQVRDVVRWPQCQPCPFSASLLRLGATAGTRLPCALLPPKKMAVRPLRHQACPWPWSQAKLQGQPAALRFMLYPVLVCGPIKARCW